MRGFVMAPKIAGIWVYIPRCGGIWQGIYQPLFLAGQWFNLGVAWPKVKVPAIPQTGALLVAFRQSIKFLTLFIAEILFQPAVLMKCDGQTDGQTLTIYKLELLQKSGLRAGFLTRSETKFVTCIELSLYLHMLESGTSGRNMKCCHL